MKKISFIFLLFCYFAFLSSQSLSQDHCYPITSDEIGLIGAGVSYNDLTVWPVSGEVTLTTGVYEMYDFQNCNIVIGGDDVIIRKCRITWNGNNIGIIRNGRAGDPRYAGLVIEDCELNGQSNIHNIVCDAGIWPGRFTMIRTWLYNIGNDAAKVIDGATVHRCYIGPVWWPVGGRSDLLQTGPSFAGTEPDPKIIVTSNTFYGYHIDTGEKIYSCLAMNNSLPYDYVIIGNWFRGASWQISVGGEATATHKIRDNVFQNDFKWGSQYPGSGPYQNYEWYNNIDSDGNPIAMKNSTVYDGSAGTVPNIPYTMCVVTIPVTGISVSPTNLIFLPGGAYNLTATIAPSGATDKSITWYSSNTSVATVDTSGAIIAVSEGNATITAETNDGGFTAQCDVSVLAPANTGTITRDYWTGISGATISDLTNNASYPDNPSGSDELTSLEAVDWNNPSDNSGWDDDYGQRIYGYLHPKTTGDYTFWIAGDNWSELFLSSDDDPANKTRIAYVHGWTAPRLWDKFSSQKSATITLSAGQKYFIEVLHKEDYGGDHVAVGWAKPGESTSAPSEVIPGDVLSPNSIAVTGVSVSPTSLSLEIGETSDLTVTIVPIDATDKSVTWSSDNSSVATVDVNGVVSALSLGQATITATTNDGGLTAQCAVSVSEAPVNEGKLYLFEADGLIIENRAFTSINLTSCTNITVRNCNVVFDRDMGFAFKIAGSSHITVENCDINGSNNACWGMDITNASDLMISNNDIHHIADDGISLHSVTNVTLQDNKIHHLIGKGTDGLIDGPCYNGHSDGIELDDVHYLYMYRNIIYDVFGTSCFIAGSFQGLYPTNLFIENNIFIGNGVGFVMYFGTVHTVRAYNNIIYNGIYGGLAFNGVNTDVDFKNNICQAINITHYGGSWDPVEHRFDNNLVSDITFGGYILNPNDVLAADPMWVNYPAFDAQIFPAEVTVDDFRLKIGSPAIDAGISTGAPVTDILSASRPLGAGFDIGVYESNGIDDTDPPTTPTGLNASNITGSSVDLQWNPSTDYTGAIYDVYENGTLVKSTYETSISRGGLLCSTNYAYKIRAHDLFGNYSGFSNIVNITTITDCTPINIALNKPVTVSNNSYDPKENLVDGDYTSGTYWAAEGFPQWAQIDLGVDCDLTSIELYPHKSRDYQYIVEVSSDGVNFTTIVDRSNNTTGGTVITDSVIASGRYIKLTVTGAATYTGTWCSIRELMVYGNKSAVKALRKVPNENGMVRQPSLNIYPNPKSKNQIATVELHDFRPDQQITAKVIGILGNTISSNNLFVDAKGYLKYTLANTELLNEGVYFILVESKTNRLKTKLIVN